MVVSYRPLGVERGRRYAVAAAFPMSSAHQLERSTFMANEVQTDWRVTDGPAIGIEPEFEITAVVVSADFYVAGSMSRHILAAIRTSTPTFVESLGRTLPEFTGHLRVYSQHPERSYPGLYPDHFGATMLGPNRGALAILPPDRYVVHLYLPLDQFEMVLPVLTCSARIARLRIEIDRTLDQGLIDSQEHFWNDRISPVILFNEFSISVETAPPT
jgi:hypothetical protein